MKAKNSVFMDTLLPLVIMVVLTIGCIVLLSARSKGLAGPAAATLPVLTLPRLRAWAL